MSIRAGAEFKVSLEGVVTTIKRGQHRMYRLEAAQLKPIHDWVQAYQDLWTERFVRLDAVLTELKDREDDDGSIDS